MRPVTTRLLLTLLAASALALGLARSAPATIFIPTETTVSSNLNPATVGQQVTFTATVVPASTSGDTPTGVVELFDGGLSLGTASLGADGQASFSTAGLSEGSHAITAQYAGSLGFLPSTSDVLVQVVDPATGDALTIAIESFQIKAKEPEQDKLRFTAYMQVPAGQPPIDPTIQRFEIFFSRTFGDLSEQFFPASGDPQPGTNFVQTAIGHYSLTDVGKELTGYDHLNITLDPSDSRRAYVALAARKLVLGNDDFPLAEALIGLGQNTGGQVVELADYGDWMWRYSQPLP